MDLTSLIFNDDSFETDMARIALPLLSNAKRDGYTPQGLFYSVYKAEKAKALFTVCHGFSEGMHKYREFIYILLNAGYSVVIYEQRGHGRSVRPIKDINTVHIDSFSSYIEDLRYVTKEIAIKEADGLPMYLFGHSMGGCIATLFQEKYPLYYKKLILSSPMLGIHMADGIKAPLGRLIAASAVKMKKSKDRVPMMGEEKEKFETSLTTGKSRWLYTQKIRNANPLLKTSAPTFGWAYAALKASKEAVKDEDKINIPTLLFQAEDETMVSNREEDKFAKNNSFVVLVRVKGSRHEILLSPKAVLEEYYSALFNFIKER